MWISLEGIGENLEELEAQPPKTRIESKTSSLERGIELLRKRYPSESSENE